MQPINLQHANEAAERCRSKVPPGSGPGPVIPPPHRDPRKQQFEDRLSQSRARAVVLEADARGLRKDPQETIERLAAERIIGQSDLAGLNYLELAVAISPGTHPTILEVPRLCRQGTLVAMGNGGTRQAQPPSSTAQSPFGALHESRGRHRRSGSMQAMIHPTTQRF